MGYVHIDGNQLFPLTFKSTSTPRPPRPDPEPVVTVKELRKIHKNIVATVCELRGRHCAGEYSSSYPQLSKAYGVQSTTIKHFLCLGDIESSLLEASDSLEDVNA